MPRQLPGEAPGFVGRATELERLEALEATAPGAGTRLVVVAGTAGAGKTSLAVRFAHRVRHRFPDGQLFVNLRGYDPGPPVAPEAALERFLHALGIAPNAVPRRQEERTELYRSLLAERRVLVVLDNASTVEQVRPLLPGNAGCLVVATSRGRLSGLSARDGAHRLTLGLLTEPEAVDLLTTATSEYRHRDEPEQLAELARLCARLPLAMRIAAERAAARPHMPLTDLIADLREGSSLWNVLTTGDDSEADAVRSVFAWSYRTLPAPSARVFRLLGLHPGPEFGTATAAALTGHTHRQIRHHLDLLAGAHLLEQTGSARYQFHDLLRAYAADQARQEESREQQRAALTRVSQWYLYTADAAVRTVQRLHPSQISGPAEPTVEPLTFTGYAEAVDWYLTERTNLLALVRATAAAGLDEITWQLPTTLDPLHDANSAVDDELETARLGLAAARRSSDRCAEAAMRQIMGYALRKHNRLGPAADCFRAAFDLHRQLGEQLGTLEAANSLGRIHLELRELSTAVEYLELTLALAREQKHQGWSAVALNNLASAYRELGQPRKAADLARQALEICRQADLELRMHGDLSLCLAGALREMGRFAHAEEHLNAAAAIVADGLVFHALEYGVLHEQAALALARGESEQALNIYRQCVDLTLTMGNRRIEALIYDGIGQALQHLGRAGEAADFHLSAAALAREHANPVIVATVLSHLAHALERSGHSKRALAARAEAEVLLAPYSDRRAEALREGLRTPG
ncbi:ATP-binding protein [Kitasatospora sp. NPDC001261]|uniref:ATP-binding protein n=1 Tax=Kitasatospora sp. NPDC001261 TaxID=3364012 RepID=UPI00368640CF